MSKVVFTPVYRRRAQGDRPKLGLPDSIRPGDYLTVFLNGAAHTRRCMQAHKGYVLTEPVRWNNATLDSSRKVFWEDIDSADRPPEGYVEQVMDSKLAKAPPPPPVEPPPPPPPPPPVEPPPPKAKPAVPVPPPGPVTPRPPPRPPKAKPVPKERPPMSEPVVGVSPDEDLADLWSLLNGK